MANFQDIKGFNIQSKSSDPVPFAQEKENNPWAGAWASGGSMNTARYEIVGLGILTAALAVGGTENPGTRTDLNEEYNGSAWSEKADLNSGRTAMGAAERGTTTSTLVFGGATTGGESALSEKWNGTSWTETNDLNSAAYRCAGAGTLTAALRIGGNIPPATANTEKFDGTSWTEVNNLNQARQFLAGGGTQTSAVVAGGTNPGGSIYGNSETFNGTSWTETSDLNTARFAAGGNAADSTDALIYGGQLPPAGPPNWQKQTEAWNGSAWTEVADLAGVRGTAGGAGASGTSALTMGGQDPGPALTTSEEWTFSGIPPATTAVGYSDAILGDMYYNTTSGQFKAIKNGLPEASWSSGGNLNTGRRLMGGFGGSASSGIAAGGDSPPNLNSVESYDGSSWSEKSEINTGRKPLGGAGTTGTSGLIAGGSAPGSPEYKNETETWDGSSWTEANNLNTYTARKPVVRGAPTSALAYGGAQTSPNGGANNEEWNGTSWTEVGDMNTARSGLAGAGVNAEGCLAIGGEATTPAGPSIVQSIVEQWNGSSWTEVSDLNEGGNGFMGSGTSTSAVVADGYRPSGSSPGVTKTEFWDGSSWTEIADTSTARNQGTQPVSSSSSCWITGGYPAIATTEEFSRSEFVIKSVTTS